LSLDLPKTGAASREAIAALEKRYGALPPDYAAFLGAHDGATPPGNELTGTNGNIYVRRFLLAAEILGWAGRIEFFPPELIPVAEDDFGNVIGLSSEDHRVYFWDHEVDGLTLIAGSFGQLLERLVPFDLSSVELLQSGQAELVWSDPNFKPKFNS
jgi:hypothetical protein